MVQLLGGEMLTTYGFSTVLKYGEDAHRLSNATYIDSSLLLSRLLACYEGGSYLEVTAVLLHINQGLPTGASDE
jgi:hypothetical protein